MQMDVHKTLSCFYTTKKITRESTRSIRIYYEIFFKWSCGLYEFATKVYFQSSVTAFAELAHKCRYHRELHTNESEMDLNYQQPRLRFSHFSVLVEQNSLLKCFVRIVFYTSAIRNAVAFHKLPNIHFCQHSLQISHNLRTINAQINIRGKKTRKLDTFANCFTVS